MFDKKFWTQGTGSYAVAILIALTIRWALMEAYVIPSGSMLPSLLIHDHIFVNKMVYGVRVPFSESWMTKFKTPTVGEVVVFKFPEDLKRGVTTFFIKRVVGVAGDKIQYRDGQLFRNGAVVPLNPPMTDEEKDDFVRMTDEDFQRDNNPYDAKDNYIHYIEDLGEVKHNVLLNRTRRAEFEKDEWEVPPGHLFAMGDNRDNSSDSRVWGFVKEEYVLGRAMFIWLSCEKTIADQTPVLNVLCNPFTLRWNRFFKQVK